MLTEEYIFNQMFHLELLGRGHTSQMHVILLFNLCTQITDDIKDIRK